MPGVLSSQSGVTFSNTRVDGSRLAEEMDDLTVNGAKSFRTPVQSVGARGGKQLMSTTLISNNNSSLNNNVSSLQVADATIFDQTYKDAREKAIVDLNSFKTSLDTVLGLLSSHVHPEDNAKISIENQCARQYNAALGDRTVSQLAVLRNQNGPVKGLAGCTIVELENKPDNEKIQILVALWMEIHIPHVSAHPQEDIDNAFDDEARNKLMEENERFARANSAHLTRLLRVTVGLPATFGMAV